MVQKLKDAANILKAKLKKDELEQSLVQVTSQQNWQAPTNILHQIANASYNYEKNQQINDFIMDKIRNKPSWRKVLKTLNLIDFLLKNGSPSLVSTYKYDIYQFKALTDYSHVSGQGIDRGQSIRDKAKGIVQLLSNQELLEDQRTKAKTIRERMSGVTGGGYNSGYSTGYSGQSSKYSGYDSKSYNNKTTGSSSNNYGQGSLNTAYGDYNYNQSTLSKYKQKETKNQKAGITGTSKKVEQISKPDITQVPDNKKPFEKEVRKLVKPGQKAIVQPSIIPQSTNQNVNVTKQATTQPKVSNNLMDDDILGFSEPVQKQENKASVTNAQVNNFVNPSYSATAPLAAQNATQQTQQQQFINQMYPTTAPLAPQNAQTQQQFINPLYGTTAPLAAQNIQNNPQVNQMNFINPMYSQTAPMTTQPQNFQNMNFMNPMYSQTSPMVNQYQPQPQTPQNWAFNQPQTNAYVNPMYSQTAPMVSQPQPQLSLNQGISLSTNKGVDNDFGNFQTGASNSNVSWLSDKQKGLIDFSDFGAEIKKDTKKATNTAQSDWAW